MIMNVLVKFLYEGKTIMSTKLNFVKIEELYILGNISFRLEISNCFNTWKDI